MDGGVDVVCCVVSGCGDGVGGVGVADGVVAGVAGVGIGVAVAGVVVDDGVVRIAIRGAAA